MQRSQLPIPPAPPVEPQPALPAQTFTVTTSRDTPIAHIALTKPRSMPEGPGWPDKRDPSPAEPLPVPPAPVEAPGNLAYSGAVLQDLLSPTLIGPEIAAVMAFLDTTKGNVPGLAGVILTAVLLAIVGFLHAFQTQQGTSNTARVVEARKQVALRRVRG